jgi:molybdenum cofactor synthesis domain-containing protein
MKKISVLSTGTELIQGALLDKNANTFCKALHHLGGNIFQCMQASDETHEIRSALEYLLQHSDAVIITGGLGPTSDDNTRFAVAEVINEPLEFNQESWEHVSHFFTKFNLLLSEANKRQALFPKSAQIIQNTRGTADGCKIHYQDKWIFMLPGPPNECNLLFETAVIPTLNTDEFFKTQERFQWLTLGFSEGTIAPQVDAIAQPLGAQTSFRWSYPYLEIKVCCETKDNLEKVKKALHPLLQNNMVSNDNSDAITQCQKILATLQDNIYVQGDSSICQWIEKLEQNNIFTSKPENDSDLIFLIETNPPLTNNPTFTGSLKLSCQLKQGEKTLHEHSYSIPNRGPEVLSYVNVYFPWQLWKALS